MGFLGVYRAIYDYAPQAEGELAIDEGDLLYILDNNGDDGWWRAKKKAGVENDEEPEGLVPNNYVEPAPAQSQARAVFDYTRQTDEELSFPEDAILEVFDTSDPDWILAGLDDEYGFVPANYIAVQEPTASSKALPHAKSPALPARSRSGVVEQEHESRMDMPSSSTNLALTLTDVVQGQKSRVGDPPSSSLPQPPRETVHSEPQASDEDENYQTPHSPALPSRPRPSQHVDPRSYQDVPSRTPMVSFSEPSGCEDPDRTPGSFHMYNINEMVSVMGKKKKMPTTLGINLKTGIILIAPERAQDDPAQEWTADKMTHYSREGKHVFMELIQPSRSIDFHAGAKDTAEEIVGSLSELAGAIRAEGLREVIMAGSQRSQRKGKILYDFMAQGDDEVTVAAGDDVSILDDSTSEEWWQVRRLKNSNQGVVPSSYIEITGSITPIVATYSDVDSAKATVEQNRLEEIRLTKEAIRASKQPQQRSRHETGRTDGDEHPKAKSKPELTKVRAWTDRSGSFTVEAQFLGLKDGKIHLHKMNGVKIAVPITKMSRADLGYVESATGISLDDDRPLADVKTAKSAEKNRLSEVGATVGKSENIDYDWFEFFLACEVAVGLCERYAQAFARDSMDESVLPDVNATILRTLGLREGDIIKVMRKLDAKYGRDRGKLESNEETTGGLFSGPGGALRNNTRKGRPTRAMQTSDVVSTAIISGNNTSDGVKSFSGASSKSSNTTSTGFDDDAWDVKADLTKQQVTANGKQPSSVAKTQSTPEPAVTAELTGSMKELSLLSRPLQPTQIEPPPTIAKMTNTLELQDHTQQLTGASPSFFSTVPKPAQSPSSPKALARHRPAPPSMSSTESSLIPPPPQRPLSAPQAAQLSVPSSSMMPQMTGPIQSQAASPGSNLNNLAQVRLVQQYSEQLQPASTVYLSFQDQGLASYSSGATNQQQYMQPMMTGVPGSSPFPDSGRPLQPQILAQPSGLPSPFPPSVMPYSSGSGALGGVNSILPSSLEPQRPGGVSLQLQQMDALGSLGGGFTQPIQPQQTGPPPPVRFGVVKAEAQRLTPQQTGRRANLAQATPQNPFGF